MNKIHKKVISIGGVTLDTPLFIDNDFNYNNYLGVSKKTVDGELVSSIYEKGTHSKLYRIYSNDNGWIKQSTINLIRLLNPLNLQTLVYSDSTSDACYFNHEGSYLQTSPLYRGSIYCTLEINIIKV